MRPDQLAERSRQSGAESDAAVLAVLARAGDSGVRPGVELAGLARLEPQTATRALRRLAARGLAGRDGKRLVWATDAGRSEAGADTPGLSLGSALHAALAFLPAEALRAFARLQLAAVPVRWHHAGAHPEGWAGFIALGPTKTGKTSIAALVCRIFGIDAVSAIKVAQYETPGSLFARRHRDSTSPTGYVLEPSPLLELPYACIDEWDKAPPAVRAAAGGLLLGTTVSELEGERVSIRPTVYVTLNTGPEGLAALHQAHVRRSVVLDTTPLQPLLTDIDLPMAELFSGRVTIARLALAQLRSPDPTLDDSLRGLLRAELRAGLTDDGWQTADVEPLARLAVGRATLAEGDLDLEQAVLATTLDYLTCAATLGHARDGFASRLAPRLGAGALGGDPGATERQLQAVKDTRQRRQLLRASTHDALVEARGELSQQLTEAISALELRRVPLKAAATSTRAAGKGLAEQLASLRGEVRQARDPRILELARERAQDPLARANGLLEQATDEHRRRHALEQQLRAARALGNVPAVYRPQAEQIRDELDKLRANLRHAHGQALAELERRALTPLNAAAGLPGQIHRDRERTRQIEAEQKQSQAQARQAREADQRAEWDRARARRQRAATELRALDTEINQLRQLAARGSRGDGVLRKLSQLRAAGQPIVTFERDAPADGLGRLLQVWEAANGATGTWRSPWEPSLALAGSETTCEQLNSWQAPGTQRALTAALSQLLARRPELAALAGPTPAKRPRSRRSPGTASRAPRPGGARRQPKPSRASTPGPAGQVRCVQCGATGRARGWLGRRLTCPRCNGPVAPIT